MAYEGMIAETISINGDKNEPISAYVARPLGSGPFPGMVLLHHAPGWDEWYREATRKFAHHGYAAISHNLYHRAGEGKADDVAGWPFGQDRHPGKTVAEGEKLSHHRFGRLFRHRPVKNVTHHIAVTEDPLPHDRDIRLGGSAQDQAGRRQDNDRLFLRCWRAFVVHYAAIRQFGRGEKLCAGSIRQMNAPVFADLDVRRDNDFPGMTVGISKIKAPLIDVVGGAHDLNAILDQMGIGIAKRCIATDLERDVREPDLPALRARRILWCGMLADVEFLDLGLGQRLRLGDRRLGGGGRGGYGGGGGGRGGYGGGGGYGGRREGGGQRRSY